MSGEDPIYYNPPEEIPAEFEVIEHIHSPDPAVEGNGCDECTDLRVSQARAATNRAIAGADGT